MAPFGIIVAVTGIVFGLSLASKLWTESDAFQTSSLTIMDTIMAPSDSLFVELENVEMIADAASSSGGFAISYFVLAVSPILSWVASRFSEGRKKPILFAGVHALVGVIFIFLEQGIALVLLLGVSAVFVNLMLSLGQQILSRRRQSLSLGGGVSTSGAMIFAFAFLVANYESDAQSEYESIYLEKETVTVDAWVDDEVAKVRVGFDWEARDGDRLPVLYSPAVITTMDLPEGAVKLVQDSVEGSLVYVIEATRSGTFPVAFEYQTSVDKVGTEWRFRLRSVPSLYYEATIDFERENCEAFSSSAIGVEYDEASAKGRTVARMRLKPDTNLAISCRPLSRDIRLEKTVFYVESVNNYTPRAGTIEGRHEATLRIAQGQLRELAIKVPPGMTITDARADWLDTWRYDPERHSLEIVAKSPLIGQSVFHFRSQSSAGSLPYTAEPRVLAFEEAASETGWIGVSLPGDIQLDEVNAGPKLAAVSIGDFPSMAHWKSDFESSGVELRKAFRYSDTAIALGLSLSKVEPEIRVISEELTSLGEDRVVHSATLTTRISRAGVFQLRFRIPDSMEIENISGKEVSHWTELKENGYTIATLHLNGRTMGETLQYVTLTGPGMQENPSWEPPRVTVVGASKQRGRLVLSPELGLRIDALEREGVSQLDPVEANLADRSKVVYRLLENDWNLVLAVQPVDPWVECRLLQDVTRKAGLSEVHAAFRYSIKNAGVKRFRVKLPGDSIGVRFEGENLANYQVDEADPTVWEVSLDRRVIGDYRLSLEYQRIELAESDETEIAGIQSLDTQLQESFLSVRAKQRLSLRPMDLSNLMTPIEWQQIPEFLRVSGQEASDLAFRTIESEYALKLELERLNMAEVLPAEVKSVRLNSILSESGVLLTEAVFRIDPGHKPDLLVRLPEHARFWSCYVNEQSVWPASSEGDLLVPLKRPSESNAISEVKLSYFLNTNAVTAGAESLSFVGPQCDLPLENIEWHVFVPRNLEIGDWEGTLDKDSRVSAAFESFELDNLLTRDSTALSKQMQKAEELLELGNAYAEKGDPQAARRALESAYELSKSDLDFNEDARVQLDNLKVQQTMVGLTSWRNLAFSNESKGVLPVSGEEDQLRFSRKEADLLLTGNSAEENHALSELARRFIAHQNAVLRNPTGLRELFPKHGMEHNFNRRLQAEPWEEMRLDLEIKGSKQAGVGWGIAVLIAGIFALAYLGQWCFGRNESPDV